MGTTMTEKIDITKFPSIVNLMDKGIQKELDNETKVWNERLHEKEYKGTSLDRFPLSPSQGGKCALALARSTSHFLGHTNYVRDNTSISTRVKRIFNRGHLLEAALIEDMEKYTGLRIIDQQRRVRLFTLGGGRHVEGSIDGIGVSPKGARVLLDYKSKGAFHSSAFNDSIAQFFQELRQTGLVEELDENCFYITDAKALFDVISFDEFFVDYLLQLNSYAFSEELKGSIDFVALFYENKNTCAQYEVRWTPDESLFNYVKDKFNYIDSMVKTPEEVPKEFALGSTRCRLCDYNDMCWGKYDPSLKPSKYRKEVLSAELSDRINPALSTVMDHKKAHEEVLTMMSQKDLTHVETSNGIFYERKFLKSPKPHYELRLSKAVK